MARAELDLASSTDLGKRRQMAARHRRRLLAATIGLVLLIGTTEPASAASPAWGPIGPVGGDTSSRQGLARTATSTTEYLHSVTSTIDGEFTHHPNGAWYRRTTSDGAAWSKMQRLNPVSHVVDSASLATAGRYVFTTWVRPAATGNARMLYVRRNTNHGNLGAWSGRLRLTSTTARIDEPSIAASGVHVFVAYTNARTGTIRLQSSHDRGRTWSARSMGTTTATAPVWTCSWCLPNTRRRTGHPIVVATGRDLAVFWVSDVGGSVRGRVSADAGAHWGTATTFGSGGSGAIPSASASSGRIVVAASDGATPGWYRVSTGGSWGPSTPIPARDVDPEPPLGYGRTPVVSLRGAAFHGVAYTVVYDVGQSTLVWRESPNGGVDWLADESVSEPIDPVNSTASIVWRAEALRVQWNAHNEGDPAVFIRSRR
jgi:hypothetical protein